MTAPRICWWRVEAGLVGNAGTDGLGDRVVDFEDDAFGTVVAVVFGLIPSLHDREGVHDVGHGVTRGGEELGQQLRLNAPLGLRAKI